MSANLESEAAQESTTMGTLRRALAKPKKLPVGIRLEGQTAIITGSNTGLGLEASRQLLKLGLSHLVMGFRSQAKGDEAARQLRKDFPSGNLTITVRLDMESYDSVLRFAEQCSTLPRIDIVILNIGLVKGSFTTLPVSGHEVTLQVNYLSTALLAILLLPMLKSKKHGCSSSRPPVLTLVASDTMYQSDHWRRTEGSVLQQFDKKDGFVTLKWYLGTKFLLALFVSRLAELVDPNDVLINMVNPGATKSTALTGEVPIIARTFLKIVYFFLAKSIENGASTYLDATLAQGVESHGSFLSERTIKAFPSIYYPDQGETLKARLWEETMEELSFANASAIVQELGTA